jgi:hypothetical protein
MEDQRTDPRTKAELLERIRRSRSALEELLRSLSEGQLTTPGANGWRIQDYLAHLAVWELGIAELLHRRSRFAAMGIDQALYLAGGQDEINLILYNGHAGLGLTQVMERFRSAHRRMLEALDALSDEDLFKPYASYAPKGFEDWQDPVINWIIGNTYAHFDEHRETIQDMLQGD